MKKSLLIIVAALLLLGCSYLFVWDRGNPQDFVADFQILKSDLATGYANLDWAAERYDIDLPKLAAKTEESLASTALRWRARNAIHDFLEAFQDKHLLAESADPPPVANGSETSTILSANLSAETSADDAISRLGYRSGDYDFDLDFDDLPEAVAWSPTADNPFPAVLLPLENNKLGVIRVPYFGQDRYEDVAREAWPEFGGKLDSSCGSLCEYTFFTKVGNVLLKKLADRVQTLEEQGMTALAVDISGNGGGSEWVRSVAQLFASTDLRCPPSSFIKHVHWRERFVSSSEWIEETLQDTTLSSEAVELLLQASTRLADLITATEDTCDRQSIWETSGRVPCSSIYTESYHSCEVFAYLDHPELAVRRSPWNQQIKQNYGAYQHSYSGPLFVITDNNTASASEYFAAVLQYNSAAKLVGKSTLGVGCGYTYGGISTYLPSLGLRVRMPDCVRYQKNGENELAGIQPDLPIRDDLTAEEIVAQIRSAL